jgi:plasmid stabilization system protein ParE
MVMENYSLVWTKCSSNQMAAIYERISEDSPKNRLKVVNEIVNSVKKAIKNPEFYPPDKYKKNNDGSYRAFEKLHYRIAYRFSSKIVRVLRIRHTKMEPKLY